MREETLEEKMPHLFQPDVLPPDQYLHRKQKHEPPSIRMNRGRIERKLMTVARAIRRAATARARQT